MEIKDWLQAIGTLGVPLTLLLVLLWWFKPKADMLIDSHIKLVNTLQEAIPEIKAVTQRQEAVAEALAERVEEHSKRALANHDKLLENQGRIIKNEESIVEIVKRERLNP